MVTDMVTDMLGLNQLTRREEENFSFPILIGEESHSQTFMSVTRVQPCSLVELIV